VGLLVVLFLLFQVCALCVANFSTVHSGTGRGTLEETRVRAFALMSKIFLHHLPMLQKSAEFENIWLRVLESAQSYMECATASHSEVLGESVPESLKNMLLVMAEPGAESQFTPGSSLWDRSWDIIDRVSPRLRGEFGQLLGFEKPVDAPPPAKPSPEVSQEVVENAPPPQEESAQPEQAPPEIEPEIESAQTTTETVAVPDETADV
jgi:hypothetical protein